MSTYWHFECLNHEPPIRSVDEFTQHTDDLHYRHAVALVDSRPVPRYADDESDLEVDNYFDRNARRFLFGHPHCEIDAVSEYDDRRPLTIGGLRKSSPGDEA